MLASSGLVVEGGLHHYTAHMAASFPEFLRPLPKSLPSRYSSPQAPVNLTHKEESEDFPYAPPAPPPPAQRMFPPPPFPLHQPYGPYGTLYPAPFTPIMRHNPPLSPLEAYPQYAASPPQSPLVKSKPQQLHHQPPPHQQMAMTPQIKAPAPQQPQIFKAPPGKEGSLKHRILRKKTQGPSGPSTSNFNKGSLIQLANGEVKRVEDMKTEDFISCAEQSTAHKLDPSTVVRIDIPNDSTTVLTLSYGETKCQVEMESAVEHPYFVFGKGWASCNPERTLQQYGLRCHRLQVGDVCISLSPRPSGRGGGHQLQPPLPPPPPPPPPSSSSSSSAETRKRRWSAPDQLPDHPPHHRPKES